MTCWLSAAPRRSRITSSKKCSVCTACRGVDTNDKHIEIIVRQMLRKVTVTEPGGTSFLVGEQVDKAEFKAENQRP